MKETLPCRGTCKTCKEKKYRGQEEISPAKEDQTAGLSIAKTGCKTTKAIQPLVKAEMNEPKERVAGSH